MRMTEFPSLLLGDTYKVVIEFSTLDILMAKLTPRDFLLADECVKSDRLSDKLLWLHTLTRAVEDGNSILPKEEVS
jgi:hypothetical protein